MGKPTDPGDSTQPLSESQVVAVTPPKPPIAPGDQSVAWKGTVVGADDFAPPPKKSRAKLAAIGVGGALVVAIGAYALWPSSKPAAPTPADSAGSAASVPPPLPADAAAPDAAAPPVDAAAPPVDAGAPPDAPAKAPAKKPVKKKLVPVTKKKK